MTRSSYLVQSDFDRLEDWCRMVRAIFGGFGPYLVGSAAERADYRDVDVRVILPDAHFDEWFGKRGTLAGARRCRLRVRYLNRAFSVWGQQETGLPIDFQVQRQTEANAEFTKPRNAMGVRDWSRIPTSGVPAPSKPGAERRPAGWANALSNFDDGENDRMPWQQEEP